MSNLALRLDPSDRRQGSLLERRGVAAALGVLILLIGSVGGWALGQRDGDVTETAAPAVSAENSSSEIAEPTVEAIIRSPGDAEGAIRSANSFLAYYVSLLNEVDAPAQLDVIVADDAPAGLVSSIEQGIASGRQTLGSAAGNPGRSTISQLSAKAVPGENGSTVVTVWSVLVSAGGDQAVANARWFTSEIALERQGEEWRLSNWEIKPGPTPALVGGSAPSSATSLLEVMADLAALRTAAPAPAASASTSTSTVQP